MTEFARLIRYCRKVSGMTQDEYVEHLSYASELFEGLNNVTLSRWENGVTSPGIRKKQAYLEFLWHQGFLQLFPCLASIREIYKHRSASPDESQQHFESIIGNQPVFKVDPSKYLFRDLDTTDLMECELIVDLESAQYPDHYYDSDAAGLARWCSHPGSIAIVATIDGHHVGHAILFRLDPATAEAVAMGHRSEFSLGTEEFVAPENTGDYFIHAFYAINMEVARMLNVEVVFRLFETGEKTKRVVTFANQPGVKEVLELFGHTIVAQGNDTEHGGQWCAAVTPVEKVLFSEIILRAIFAIEEE